MAINKKLIHFKTKEAFEREKANILETSIVFIKDSQQIYTHGQFYNCSDMSEEEIKDFLDKELEGYVKKEELADLANYYTKQESDNKFQSKLPEGEIGQVLTKTENGLAWDEADVMSADDKELLNYVRRNKSNFLHAMGGDGQPMCTEDGVTIATVDGEEQNGIPNITWVSIQAATPTSAGVMSANDKQKLDNTKKEWFGSQDEFNAIDQRDENTLYYITEEE